MDCSLLGSSVHGDSPGMSTDWSGLLCTPPGDLPNPGIEPMSLTSPALARGFLTSEARGIITSETRLIKGEYKKRNRKYCFQALSLTTFSLFFFESTSGIVFPFLVAEKKMDLKLGRKLLEVCRSLAIVLDRGSVPIRSADFWMEPCFILSVNASELMGNSFHSYRRIAFAHSLPALCPARHVCSSEGSQLLVELCSWRLSTWETQQAWEGYSWQSYCLSPISGRLCGVSSILPSNR